MALGLLLALSLASTPSPSLSPTPWDKASHFIEKHAYALAERLLRAIPVDPNDEEAVLQHDTLLARLLVAEKRYGEAEPLLIRLIDKDPALADRHLFELANERLARGEFEGALSAAQGVDSDGLFAEQAEIVRLTAMSMLGQNDAALKTCQQSVTSLSLTSPPKLNACGQIFYRGQNLDRAKELLRYVVRFNPESKESKLADQFLVKSWPDYATVQRKGDQAFAFATSAIHRRHVDQAGRYFAVALSWAKDPLSRAQALFGLADIEERKLHYEQAVSGYVRAANLVSDDELSAQALFAAGVLATRMKNLSLAKALYQKLLVDHPLAEGRSQALFGLGFTAWMGHDYSVAKQFLSTLLTLDLPQHDKQRARYWYGRTLEAVDDAPAAQIAYSEILRDDPAGYYAVRADERLDATGMRAIDLPFDAPQPNATTGHIVALVQRIVALASRALRGDALHMLERLAHGQIPTREDAVALRDGFMSVGEKVKAEVVLALWRYEHLGELTPDERYETIRARHPRLFGDAVVRAADRVGIKPTDVFAIVRQESRFATHAHSPSGARGLMQLMIPTARELAHAMHLPFNNADNLYQPDLNLRLGSTYLSHLLKHYDHREFAFAAYNAGPGNVEKWLDLFGDLPVDVFCELIPFVETRDYVQRVVGYARGYELTERTTLGSL